MTKSTGKCSKATARCSASWKPNAAKAELADEQARQLDVSRPAELPDRAQLRQSVAGIGEHPPVPRPARWVAADIADPRHAAGRNPSSWARNGRVLADAGY